MHFLSQFLTNCLVASSVIGVAKSAAVPTNSTQAPTATIASGVVVGTTKTPTNQPSSTAFANAYLGVPFAGSPPERFSPPQKPRPWKSPLQAQSVKPACVQQFSGNNATQSFLEKVFNNPLHAPPEESEDCLYLNIYTPADASPTNKKSVLFWIFGGNLQFGTGALDLYDGTSFAVNTDVVVVTINYRTNIFGFSNSPEIPFGQQNSGFLDQRMALSWVQENIAQFGGDPEKVTIFGESAGGYSVKQLLANPPSPLPFRAAIMESEALGTPVNGSIAYKEVLAKFSCLHAPSPINCLRKVPAADLKHFLESNALSFAPVDGDGTNLNNVKPIVDNRKLANVPFFIGTNSDEARAFIAALGINNGTEAVDTVLNWIAPNNTNLQQSITAQYAADITQNGYVLASRIATDFAFTCPASSLSNSAAAKGYNVWRYLYSASFPNFDVFSNAGVYHSSEIPEVFRTYPLKDQYGAVTPQQVGLSKYMQSAWANFAKDPASGPGWPRIDPATGTGLQQLGADGSDSGKTVPQGVADYPCPAYDPILAVSGY